MNNLPELEDELNRMTASGRFMEALERFYAEDCVFQEGNQAPRDGKAAQRAHLEAFFKMIKGFNGATLHGATTGEGVTMSEWTFDIVGPDGPLIWNEVLRRRWLNGRVVSERYYMAP